MKRLVLCLIFGAVGGFLGAGGFKLAAAPEKFCFQENGYIFQVLPTMVSMITLTTTGQSAIADLNPRVIKAYEPLVACPKAP